MNAKEIMRLSESGDYLKLIELTMSAPDGKCNSFEEVYLRIQFGLAYQHAGVYHTSLRFYEDILEKIKHFNKSKSPVDAALFSFAGVTWGDVQYNLKLQRAVLLERLERVSEAKKIFDKLPEPAGFKDLRIAKASLHCWYLSTQIRLCLRRHDYHSLASLANAKVSKSDGITQLWAAFARALSVVKINNTSDLKPLVDLNKSLEEVDLPGLPWFLLLEGQHLKDTNLEFSTNAFEHALEVGKRLGRFFIIASAAEGLYDNLKLKGNPEIETLEQYFLQQLRALSQCQLTAYDPYRSRLFKAGTEDLGWKANKLANVFIKYQGMLRKRTDFQIGKMCEKHVAEGNPSKDADDVFEKFVCKWAENMFPHYKVNRAAAGMAAADIVCIREHSGKKYAKLIQAKLWSKPRDAAKLKSQQRIQEVKHLLGIDEVEEYYFMVAKKGLIAWDDKNDWHIEDVKTLKEKVVNVGKIIPYTEPMLQTDIIEIPELQEYFH